MNRNDIEELTSSRYYYTYQSPIGDLTLVSEKDSIIYCGLAPFPIELGINKKTPVIEDAYKQLLEYFNSDRYQFTIKLSPQGTSFQQKVWKELIKIPYGTTSSYIDIAKKIGNPQASRAIGYANHKNPILIFIPCHRVIGKNGNLTGFAAGLDNKRYLLNLEKNIDQSSK